APGSSGTTILKELGRSLAVSEKTPAARLCTARTCNHTTDIIVVDCDRRLRRDLPLDSGQRNHHCRGKSNHRELKIHSLKHMDPPSGHASARRFANMCQVRDLN